MEHFKISKHLEIEQYTSELLRSKRKQRKLKYFILNYLEMCLKISEKYQISNDVYDHSKGLKGGINDLLLAGVIKQKVTK